MAHICLQRQAEVDIVLEYGRELGAISDGSPVVRDEYRLRGIQGHHCLDLSGVKSLEQRRDNVFGFSWEWKALGHQGSCSCWFNRRRGRYSMSPPRRRRPPPSNRCAPVQSRTHHDWLLRRVKDRGREQDRGGENPVVPGIEPEEVEGKRGDDKHHPDGAV